MQTPMKIPITTTEDTTTIIMIILGELVVLLICVFEDWHKLVLSS